MSDCPQGKLPFASQQAALRHARGMQGRGKNTAPGFAYLCTCGAWHMTQQSPQDRRRRAKRAWQAVGSRRPPGLNRTGTHDE